MWYSDYENKKLNLCMLNSFSMCYPDNQLEKKLDLGMLLQANKNMFAKIK